MYLIINGNKHSVSKRIVTNDTIKYLTVEPKPEDISGTIIMYRDDGFLMSTDNADKFERKTYNGTLLVLTNKPEPVPVPAPEPTEASTFDMAQAILEGVNAV